MNIAYIIAAPDYRRSSNGIHLLHKLADMINKSGYEAYVNSKVTMKGVPTVYDKPELLRKLIIDGAIAIYPEAYRKNFLWSKNPVGWYLFVSEPFEFEREGLTFTFNKIYKDDVETLTIQDIEPFFNNESNFERKWNAVYIGKGQRDARLDSIPDKFIINRDIPDTRKKLADLLKRSKALYTYDAFSYLAAEANFCGCPVVLLENGQNRIELRGFSLGMVNDVEDIEKAKSQIEQHNLYYRDIINNSENEVTRFIKITQGWARERIA
jgi:hypothetical protein